jgi:hypothetical protein
MKYLDPRAACLALLLGAPLVAAPALAQTSPEQAPPAAGSELETVDQAKLDQFADAYVAVEEIRIEASAELEGANDGESAQTIEQDARSRMLKAVEESGLTVEEYNDIAQQVNANPELRQDVQSRIDERTES